MLAVTFPAPGRAELIETPRPALLGPEDAIVLVTTTAIGPWDVAQFLRENPNPDRDTNTPGGEFAGIVVETGENISEIEPQVTRAQRDQLADELAECRASPFPDADGDGEADTTDACPDTDAAAAVDATGCGLEQFCASVPVASPKGFVRCLVADWRADEPLAMAADCRPRRSTGLSFECAARTP